MRPKNSQFDNTFPPGEGGESALCGVLRAYAAGGPARFHMPGHKGLGSPCFAPQYDGTELTGTDNLLSPEGVLAAAQEEAAKAYGAARTFFCTGGATAGVAAMLLALPPNSTVVGQRGCHRSVYGGLALGGHRPVYVQEGPDGLLAPAAVEEALCAHPGAAAVMVTRPDYFGRCGGLPTLAAACRAHGAALLVDEAHGAHFALSSALPQAAAGYADAWVNSAHKTLRCPNQGAYLHCGSGKVSPDALRRALFLLHTTSPAYPLLAALDCAWREAKGWDYPAHIARVRRLALPEGVERVFCQEGSDPTRLVLDVSGRKITGFAAEAALRRAGVWVEMADWRHVVAITVPIDPDAWYNRLETALKTLPWGKGRPQLPPAPPLPQAAMLPREAMLAPVERKPLCEAVGRVAAEAVGVYPPGSAIVAPGEVFTAEAAAYLKTMQQLGGSLFGCAGGVPVVRE